MNQEGFCVKCKKKRNMINVKFVKSKNNRDLIKGKCEICGTNISAFPDILNTKKEKTFKDYAHELLKRWEK